MPGLYSLHTHEPNKSVLYKLSSLSYPVAGVENGPRQNLSHASIFIFLDLTLHLHVYLLLPATHSLSQHTAPGYACSMQAVPFPSSLGTYASSARKLLRPNRDSQNRLSESPLQSRTAVWISFPNAHCPSLSSNFPIPHVLTRS